MESEVQKWLNNGVLEFQDVHPEGEGNNYMILHQNEIVNDSEVAMLNVINEEARKNDLLTSYEPKDEWDQTQSLLAEYTASEYQDVREFMNSKWN